MIIDHSVAGSLRSVSFLCSVGFSQSGSFVQSNSKRIIIKYLIYALVQFIFSLFQFSPGPAGMVRGSLGSVFGPIRKAFRFG